MGSMPGNVPFFPETFMSPLVNSLMAMTLWSTLALAFAAPVNATSNAGKGTPGSAMLARDANNSLIAGAEVFENLTESARTETQPQFDAAMANYGRLAPSIDMALTPGARALLAERIHALKASWAKGNRTSVAMHSIESYRLLVQGISRRAGEPPVEVALLDYSGFKLSALARDASPDWAMIGKTTAEAEKWWRVIAPKVRNGDLRQSMQRTMKAYAAASRTANVALLAYAADMDLILVDELETDLAHAR